jgi:molybdopterin-guanine dinucleotide biosynthesis protein A
MPKYAALVLAGGRSTRLGRDKASEPLLGVPMLQRVIDRLAGLVDEYVIVTRDEEQALPSLVAPAPVAVVADVFRDAGPLGGIYAGLKAARAPHCLALACDMPLVQRALVAELLRLAAGYDVVMPVSDGLPQPLCAVYTTACLEPIRSQLEAGKYKITNFLGYVRPRYVQPEEWREFDPEGLSFLNVNREEDLQRAIEIIRAEESAASAPAP